MGRPGIIAGLITAMLICAGCGAPAQTEVDDQAHTVTSWVATAHAVADAWQHAQVPDAYAQQTLEAAQQGLAEADDATATLSASDQRDSLRAQIERFTPLLHTLHDAVEHDDHPGMATKLAVLENEQRRLAALVSGTRTQP